MYKHIGWRGEEEGGGQVSLHLFHGIDGTRGLEENRDET